MLLLVVVRVSTVVVVFFINPCLLNAGWHMDLISVALVIFLQCGGVLVCVLVSMVLFFVLHWLCYVCGCNPACGVILCCVF